MGLQADAVAIAELTGKNVSECKKALKDAGDSLRNKSIEEKAAALFGRGPMAVKKAEKKVEAPPPPPPPVEKAIDPPVEKQVQDPAPESGVVEVDGDATDEDDELEDLVADLETEDEPSVVETYDEDDMGTKFVDEV